MKWYAIPSHYKNVQKVLREYTFETNSLSVIHAQNYNCLVIFRGKRLPVED